MPMAELDHDVAPIPLTAVGQRFVLHWGEMGARWGVNRTVSQIHALLFISGIVVGLPLLGIALWRSRVAPRWMAIALIIGGATHPFLPNHVVAGIGLLVAGIGFAGATRALLRMTNNEFDLPPVPLSRA